MSKENEKKEPTVKKTVKPKAKRSLHGKVKVVKYCECGCGAVVKRHFVAGHDARLKSSLRKAAKKGDTAAIVELKERGWPQPVDKKKK